MALRVQHGAPSAKTHTIISSLTGLKTSADDVFQFVQADSQPVLRPVQFSEYKTHRICDKLCGLRYR